MPDMIDGTAVVERAPAKYRFRPEDALMVVRGVEEVLLADGRVLYSCTDCDYAAQSARQVIPHRKVHSGRVRKPRRAAGQQSARRVSARASAAGRIGGQAAQAVSRSRRASVARGTPAEQVRAFAARLEELARMQLEEAHTLRQLATRLEGADVPDLEELRVDAEKYRAMMAAARRSGG